MGFCGDFSAFGGGFRCGGVFGGFFSTFEERWGSGNNFLEFVQTLESCVAES